MKILFVSAWYPTREQPFAGGFVRDLAALINDRECQSAVIHADLDWRHLLRPAALGVHKAFAVENEVPTFRLTAPFPPKINRWFIDKWQKRFATLYLDYFQRFGKPDLIHAHTYLGAYVALKLGQDFEIPYIYTEHNAAFLTNSLPKRHLRIVKQVATSAAKVTAVSRALAEKMPGNPIIIPNFVDTHLFRIRHCPALEPFTFIAVGDLVALKSIGSLIMVFSEIARQKDSAVNLLIVGEGPEKKRLKRLVRSLRMEERVSFSGPVPLEQVPDYLNQAHALVLNSQDETFGTVGIEAMSCGLPVLATRCGGPEEYVRPEVGILVEKGNQKSMLKAMLEVMEQYGRYDKETIRGYVQRHFGHEVIREHWMEAYKKVLLQSRPNDP